MIICDEISHDLQSIRVRDPAHGWEITLKAEAFLDAVNRGHVDPREEGEFSTTVQQIIKL